MLAGALEARGPSRSRRRCRRCWPGLPAAGVPLSDDPLPLIAHADALIDFTRPAVSVALAELAAQARIVHVIGTTGCSAEDEAKIRAAARHAVIVKSGNMSLGVNLLAALVKQAAKALPGFDVEIVEMHHRMKVDAPSGTALLLGEAAAEGPRRLARQQGGARRATATPARAKTAPSALPALRGGTVVGEHQVVLAGPHERIELGHVAEDRMIFAQWRGGRRALGPGQEARPLRHGGRSGPFGLKACARAASTASIARLRVSPQ